MEQLADVNQGSHAHTLPTHSPPSDAVVVSYARASAVWHAWRLCHGAAKHERSYQQCGGGIKALQHPRGGTIGDFFGRVGRHQPAFTLPVSFLPALEWWSSCLRTRCRSWSHMRRCFARPGVRSMRKWSSRRSCRCDHPSAPRGRYLCHQRPAPMRSLFSLRMESGLSAPPLSCLRQRRALPPYVVSEMVW